MKRKKGRKRWIREEKKEMRRKLVGDKERKEEEKTQGR